MFVSGDSWTSCWPLEQRLGHRKLGWPNLVAEHFDFELIDKSRAGASNYRIYRKAFDAIVDESADLILVFLTHWTRFEMGSTCGPKPGRIYQHIPNDPDSDQAFRLFFNGYKIYTDILRQIVSLQCLARTHQVPCFFLDTFDNNIDLNLSLHYFKQILRYNAEVFENMDDDRILEKFKVAKQLTDSIDIDTFISRKSYQSHVQLCELDQGHPTETGHRKIADVVINFLQGKNYGQTL